MSNRDFMGGFISTETDYIPEDLNLSSSTTHVGSWDTGDVWNLRSSRSWPKHVSGGPSKGEYRNYDNDGSSGSITIDTSTYGNYVFISGSGGGGGGAHDNDCRTVYRPGGQGGAGKAIVDLSAVGSNVINYTFGTGGPGTPGNDAYGNPGSATNIAVGNFSMSCGGGGGGSEQPYGNTGTVNVSGPNLHFSTSGVFSSPALTDRTGSSYTFTSIPTSAGGGGGRCGENATSGAGANGFLYIRYGTGMNHGATVAPGYEDTTAASYTPLY